jgi:hypothetical protein
MSGAPPARRRNAAVLGANTYDVVLAAGIGEHIVNAVDDSRRETMSRFRGVFRDIVVEGRRGRSRRSYVGDGRRRIRHG